MVDGATVEDKPTTRAAAAAAVIRAARGRSDGLARTRARGKKCNPTTRQTQTGIHRASPVGPKIAAPTPSRANSTPTVMP